ncbi:MAG: GAF domain-containing protein [Deltaproteobacteria bacterium]|nr:GAF domain-containing protein [Deltaproteobacteria bacterium]
MDESHSWEHPTEENESEIIARAAEMAAEAARARERLEAMAHAAELVAKVAMAVTRELDLSSMARTITHEAVASLGASAAHVYLADEKRRELRLIHHRNLPDDLAARLARVSFDAPLLAAKAALTRRIEAVLSPEILDPSFSLAAELLERTHSLCLASMPLIFRGGLVGVLTLAFPEARQLERNELAALATCAEIFAVGVAHAQAFDRERRGRQLVEAVSTAVLAISGQATLNAILQNIVDHARDVVDAEFAAAGIARMADVPFDPWVTSGMPEEVRAKIGRLPRPVGTLGVVAMQGKAVRIADVRQHPEFRGFPTHHPIVTSFLGVPIRHGERTVGILYLGGKRGGGEFTEEDERAVMLLADHAGIALDQAQLRAQIESERARFDAILESAPSALFFVDAKTRRVTVNPKAIELGGQPAPPETTIDEYRGHLKRPDGTLLDRKDWPEQRALKGTVVPPDELILTRPDGGEVPVLISAAPVFDQAGQVQGAVVAYQDIFALKELQRLREEWASIVAHDLRQPLHVVSTNLELLEKQLGFPVDRQVTQRIIANARKATSSLNKMINDLADVTSIETRRLSVERKPCDLPVLCRDVVDGFQAQAVGREIKLSIAEAPPVLADATRIEQVLVNLLGNAVKYSDPGSEIHVAVAATQFEVRVSITNRGAGIAPEELPRIFERYYRTARTRRARVGGLGLGLYISRGIVEAHGGRIWAESIPGETTTFSFTLPRAES